MQWFINQQIEQTYFELFKKLFVDDNCITHDGICIKAQEGHFFHMFYRDKWKPTLYFDQWLANRIQDIYTIITTTSIHTNIFEWLNPISQRKERWYFYTKSNIFIWFWKDNQTQGLFFITAYKITKTDYQKFIKRNWIFPIT